MATQKKLPQRYGRIAPRNLYLSSYESNIRQGEDLPANCLQGNQSLQNFWNPFIIREPRDKDDPTRTLSDNIG